MYSYCVSLAMLVKTIKKLLILFFNTSSNTFGDIPGRRTPQVSSGFVAAS
jgi:hypothetical protein